MNPWIYRFMALTALLFVYGAGYSAGRDQCQLRYQRSTTHHHQ